MSVPVICQPPGRTNCQTVPSSWRYISPGNPSWYVGGSSPVYHWDARARTGGSAMLPGVAAVPVGLTLRTLFGCLNLIVLRTVSSSDLSAAYTVFMRSASEPFIILRLISLAAKHATKLGSTSHVVYSLVISRGRRVPRKRTRAPTGSNG